MRVLTVLDVHFVTVLVVVDGTGGSAELIMQLHAGVTYTPDQK